MKFELKPFNRNVSDKDFLSDLKRVASELKLDSLSVDEYDKNGKYHPSTIQRRFGSWSKALTQAGLQIRKYSKLTKSELLEDLKKTANSFNKKRITADEYQSLGKYALSPFTRVFGSWAQALEEAGLEKTKTTGIADEEYFKNIEEIWIKLGKQPKYVEIQKPFSKYSAGAYEQRFGSWRKALEVFIEFVNHGENESSKKEEKIESLPLEKLDTEAQTTKHKTNRNINWRLRFIVMKRDNFKCKKCGRSPATDPLIILHVDHKTAWANDGETVLENLETLCSKCNIGKSNLE